MKQSKVESTIKQFNIRSVFLGDESGNPVWIDGKSHAGDDVPTSNPDYVFCPMMLTDYIMFRNSGHTALKIIGHTGTGKSSFVEEFHARLNLPLYVCNVHPRTTAADLIGEYGPTEQGGLKFYYGPVALAAINGSDCLLDEYNLMDPAEANALNDLLEGRSVYIRELQDWIHPRPGFRVIATVNKKGPCYIGRNTQDAANDDRFVSIFADYMKRDHEISLIKKVLSKGNVQDDVAQNLAIKFRDVAESVRKQFIGESDSASALDVTISTRSLLSWVKFFLMSKNIKKPPENYEPIHYALERAKTFQASDETRLAIHALVEQTFGFKYNTPYTNQS